MTLAEAQAFAATSAIAPRSRLGKSAGFILALVVLRWLAGIVENFAFPALSQLAAIVMLTGLALLLLMRMRLATDASLFITGILAWIASGLLSFAANPGGDLRATIALLTLLLLYALFANAATSFLRNRESLPAIGLFLTIFIAVGFVLSLAQVLANTGFVAPGRPDIQRAFGSDVHPVSFAIQITAALVALEIIRIKLGRNLTWLHGALLIAGGIALYLTFARTAWVMGLMIIALSVILRGPLARRLTVFTLAAAFAFLFLTLTDRFSDLASLPEFLSGFSIRDAVFDWRYIDNSMSWRIINWSFGLRQALEQPLLGFGPGQSAVASYFNLEMHNIFLEVFFEGGIFGLTAFLLTLAGLFRLHRRLPHTTPADRYTRILANAFAFTLLLAVTFSTSFVDQLMSFLLYLLLLSAAGAPAAKPCLLPRPMRP